MLEEKLSSYQETMSGVDDQMSIHSATSSFYNYKNLKTHSTKKSLKHLNDNSYHGFPMLSSDRRSIIMISPRGRVPLNNLLSDDQISEEAEYQSSEKRSSFHSCFTSPEEKVKVSEFYKQFDTTIKDRDKTKKLLEFTLAE